MYSSFPVDGSNARILAPQSELSFYCPQSVDLPRDITPLQAWNLIMAKPLPFIKTAFLIRDKVSALFGVKQIGGFERRAVDQVQVGEKLDFFVVEYIDDQVMLLTERDKHLDVMTCVSVQDRRLTITSSVRTHNAFGRLYMIPVAPAHKLIVRTMLNRLQKAMA